jgi:hypothetical protein
MILSYRYFNIASYLLLILSFAWAEARFSSFKCIGGHDVEGLDQMRRKCYFTDVCHKSGEGDVLHYYADKSLPATPVLQSGNTIRYEFPPDFLNLGTFDKFTTKWGPTMVYESMPSDAKYDIASRAILFQSYGEFNPGHLVYE